MNTESDLVTVKIAFPYMMKQRNCLECGSTFTKVVLPSDTL